jgi:hypothetical protein
MVHAHDTDHLVLELRWSTECGKRVAGSQSMATWRRRGRAWRRRAVGKRSGECGGGAQCVGKLSSCAPLRYEAHTCVAAAGWRQRTRGEALSVRNAAAKRCRDERLRAVGGGGPAVVEALCDAAETCGSTLSVPTP